MKVGIINMKIVKKGKYLVVIRKNKTDKNGNPKFILNIFEENENGEYIEIKEIRTTSYNIDLKLDYYINKLLEGENV